MWIRKKHGQLVQTAVTSTCTRGGDRKLSKQVTTTIGHKTHGHCSWSGRGLPCSYTVASQWNFVSNSKSCSCLSKLLEVSVESVTCVKYLPWLRSLDFKLSLIKGCVKLQKCPFWICILFYFFFPCKWWFAKEKEWKEPELQELSAKSSKSEEKLLCDGSTHNPQQSVHWWTIGMWCGGTGSNQREVGRQTRRDVGKDKGSPQENAEMLDATSCILESFKAIQALIPSLHVSDMHDLTLLFPPHALSLSSICHTLTHACCLSTHLSQHPTLCLSNCSKILMLSPSLELHPSCMNIHSSSLALTHT